MFANIFWVSGLSEAAKAFVLGEADVDTTTFDVHTDYDSLSLDEVGKVTTLLGDEATEVTEQIRVADRMWGGHRRVLQRMADARSARRRNEGEHGRVQHECGVWSAYGT